MTSVSDSSAHVEQEIRRAEAARQIRRDQLRSDQLRAAQAGQGVVFLQGLRGAMQRPEAAAQVVRQRPPGAAGAAPRSQTMPEPRQVRESPAPPTGPETPLSANCQEPSVPQQAWPMLCRPNRRDNGHQRGILSRLPDSFVPGSTAYHLRAVPPVLAKGAGDGSGDPRAGTSRGDVRSKRRTNDDDTQHADAALPFGLGLAGVGRVTPPVDAPPPSAATIPESLIQQVLAFSALRRADDGSVEFAMGIGEGSLRGLQVRVVALGDRRISVALEGTGCSNAELSKLVDTLAARGLDVVDASIVSGGGGS